MAINRLDLVAVVVPDYDAGIAFYCGVLGLALVRDEKVDEMKRWVVVSPGGGGGILLARAADQRQQGRIGDQTGGRCFLFFHADDFAADHAWLLAAGVEFLETPRSEPYGMVAKFRDPFGNVMDLIGPA
ncbi:VOC family protein [Acuticoccus sp. MNP-M23]|uniref:VOC family protein n=1 Tax=Acuticoccus sp. MNP-M23 TaxID=3072793 RepID=UPI002814A8AB|nr:VOC family protein [Acuticoccus sp. MNP-M23]WMS42354.1 VOC family protein [Acuticoccus sp. MNP-M23]